MTFEPETSLKLLVIDDDVDGVVALADGLRALGHDVTLSFSGEQALELVEHGFDAAVIDLRLDDMGGLEVARKIRRRGSRVRLVALTGDVAVERTECLAAGFDAHATKPCPLPVLDALVRGAS